MVGALIVAGAFGGTGAPGGRFEIVGNGVIFEFVNQRMWPQMIGPSIWLFVPEMSTVDVESQRIPPMNSLFVPERSTAVTPVFLTMKRIRSLFGFHSEDAVENTHWFVGAGR